MSKLTELLKDHPDNFNVGKGITVIAGRTLVQSGLWKKAIVLVDVANKRQLRLYAWQKNKQGEWKLRQKFNMSKSYAPKIAECLMAFHQEETDEEPESETPDENEPNEDQ